MTGAKSYRPENSPKQWGDSLHWPLKTQRAEPFVLPKSGLFGGLLGHLPGTDALAPKRAVVRGVAIAHQTSKIDIIGVFFSYFVWSSPPKYLESMRSWGGATASEKSMSQSLRPRTIV
jgi:hypothetical protein